MRWTGDRPALRGWTRETHQFRQPISVGCSPVHLYTTELLRFEEDHVRVIEWLSISAILPATP
jgi:hypothetical protein